MEIQIQWRKKFFEMSGELHKEVFLAYGSVFNLLVSQADFVKWIPMQIIELCRSC